MISTPTKSKIVIHSFLDTRIHVPKYPHWNKERLYCFTAYHTSSKEQCVIAGWGLSMQCWIVMLHKVFSMVSNSFGYKIGFSNYQVQLVS